MTSTSYSWSSAYWNTSFMVAPMPRLVSCRRTRMPGSMPSSARSVEPSSATRRSYGRAGGWRASVRRILSPSLYAKVAANTRIRSPTDLDRRPPRPHRRLDGGQGANDATPEHSARERYAVRVDRVDELQALVLERLAWLDLGADDVAVAYEQLELAVGFRDGVAGRDAALVVPDPLDVVEVVEDHAAAAAHRHHLAHFVWIRPADVDVADDAVPVAERGKSDVVARRLQHPRADRRSPLGLVLEQVIEDSDVVRRQIPDGVDILADRPEVGPCSVKIVDLPELFRRHALLHLPHAGVVEKRIPDHQHTPRRRGQLAQRVAASDVQRHRLFDQHVMAALERRLHQFAVRRCGGGDDHRIDAIAGEYLRDGLASRDGGIARSHVRQPFGAAIADDRQLNAREIVENACVIGSPVPKSNERDAMGPSVRPTMAIHRNGDSICDHVRQPTFARRASAGKRGNRWAQPGKGR